MKRYWKRAGIYTLGIGVSLMLAQPALAAASYGRLDTTFNATGSTPGTVIHPLGSGGDHANSLALQPDGKIVVAGGTSVSANVDDFVIVRYNADGTLDTSFNGTGVATAHIGLGGAASGVVVQPDGKLVAAGSADSGGSAGGDFALVRFNSDGSLDTSFGAGGTVTTDLGGNADSASDIAIQSDGKLVVSGYTSSNSGPALTFALARYNSDGSLDTSFGSNGKVITSLSSANGEGVMLSLQPDGKIVIASTYDNGLGADSLLARFNTDGTLDTSFNPIGSPAGVVKTSLGSQGAVSAVVVQPDGKIVAGGYSGTPAVMTLLRYNADGSLDTGFGTNGVTTTTLNSSHFAAIQALAVLPNGNIVAGGYGYPGGGSDDDFVVMHADPQGAINGIFVTPVGTGQDNYLSDLAVQPDGKLVAVGTLAAGVITATSTTAFGVARIETPDNSWDITPDTFAFTNATDVTPGSEQTSDMITITGLGSGISVPLIVNGGEYALNGATTYTSNTGWVQNGDQVNVRHTAASGNQQTTTTTLTVGGIAPNNNRALALGTTAAGIFSSTTAAAASTTTTTSGSGGGGAVGPWLLALVITGCWRKRGRRGASL